MKIVKHCGKNLLLVLLALCFMLGIASNAAAVAVKKLTFAGKEVGLPMSGGTVYENTGAGDSEWRLDCTDGAYTLTLSNAVIAGGIASTLDSLTVCVPKGTSSSVTSDGTCISALGSLSIIGGGTLSASSGATDDTPAVCASDSLTVSGTTIDVKSSSAKGIQGDAVTFEDSNVTVGVRYGGIADCMGILSGRFSISSSGVTVNVSGGAAARAIYCDLGLTILESDVTASASAVSGGIGMAAKSGLYISGGTVNASANSNSVCAVGIDSLSTSLNLTVAGGSITADGTCTDAGRDYAYGIHTHLLYITGGSITASGTDGGIVAGNNQSDGVTLGDSVGIDTGGSVNATTKGPRYFKTFTETMSSLTFLNSGYVTGAASPVILRSSITALSVSGEARIGQTLTAVIAPTGAAAKYSWYRSDTASNTAGTTIPDADGSCYILSGDDLGKYVYCAASGTGGFEGTLVSECTGKVKPSLNLPLTAVHISGFAKIGGVLTAVTEPAEASASYTWFRSSTPGINGSAIEGAQNAEYTLVPGDAGMYIYCAASGNGDYTGTVYSAATGAVETSYEKQAPTLVYVPLDNRGVNVDRVVYEAEAAGFKVVVPLEDLYATRLDGQPRNSNGTGCGDGKALIAWLHEMDKYSDYFVISLDQLLSGGLVNSRVMANTNLSDEYAIIDALLELSNDNHVYIIDSVARLATCTVGYQGGDEASYNALRSYNLLARAKLTGQQLTLDNIIAGYDKDEQGNQLTVDTKYANLVRNNFLVRQRKLRLIDYMLRQDIDGKMKYFIGVDDSNSLSTVQTNEISYIRNEMGGQGTIYSGTDELGVMAVLRLMLDYYESGVKVATVYFGGMEDSDTGSDYDIETIRENVEQHLDSLGPEITESKSADIEIVVLTSPAKTTMNAKYITQMLDHINGNIASGMPTIVIDPVPGAYSNSFEYRLIKECETSMLLAYSSWGTAGNAIGLALGNGISRYLYLQSKNSSSDEADKAFLKGLTFSLEKDISYLKGGGQTLFADYLTSHGWSTVNFFVSKEQTALVCSNLETILKTSEYNVTEKDILGNLKNRRYLKGLGGECGVIRSIKLSNFSAPFFRIYEIRFDIDVELSNVTIKGFDGNITVTLPYAPAKGQLVYGLSVYFTDDSGKVHQLPCKYDPSMGCVVFTISDLSEIFLSSMSIGTETALSLFTDVSPHSWYYFNVLYASDKGLMNGTGAETFEPEASMTRAMFISVLYRIAAPAISGSLKNHFSDVSKSDWYYDAVSWAFESGIVTGHANGNFNAQDFITRQEAAVLMYRLAAYLNADLSLSGSALSGLEDGTEISGYAYSAMEWAVERGIISGMPDSRLSPDGSVTRAQAAAMYQRFCDALITNI